MRIDRGRNVNSQVPDKIRRLVDRVVGGDGFCSPLVRTRIFDLASSPGTPNPGDGLTSEIARIVNKIARYAYRVVDEDFDALRERGFSDDEIFEIVICAAVGAAHARLLSGLEALENVIDETGT